MTPDESADRILRQLRAARHQRDLSLQALADRHGMSPATVRAHEAGDRALTLPRLIEHAGWLGLEVVLLPVGTGAGTELYQRGYDQAVADACKAWGVRTDDDGGASGDAGGWGAASGDAYGEIEQETSGGAD